MQSYIIIVGMIVLGYAAHNMTVTWSSLALLVLKILLPQDKLLFFGNHGLNWGVVILTAAVMTPMATGKIGYQDIIAAFKSPEGILSILVGTLVALLGKWGTEVMLGDPQVVVSTLVGTILGVVFLKGVPVGPMIASGILYVLLKIFHGLLH